MLLGKIFGKVTTKEFKFLVEHETRKFEYIQVYHPVYDYVLCQVVEIEKQEEMTTALCQVIGYKDKDGKIKKLKIPFEPGTEVFIAEDDFIAQVIKLEDPENGAYIGKLEGKDIRVSLDLKKLLTKHVAILAKSGSGKSYTVGVLLEEIIDKKVPLVIIDPHGEYSSMAKANNNKEEVSAMASFDIKPQGFSVAEYGDPTTNPQVRPLRLPDKLTSKELIELLPVKLSSAQMGTLYGATQAITGDCSFDSVLYELQQEESNTKWNIISVIEEVRDSGLFSPAPTPYHEIVKTGTCSIINFRGISPEVQDMIVYKMTKDLFELRKQNKIPPFFLVVEEAHNYCPERNFGEKKSSKVLRTIASEGRKFGLGLCVVSQRPARVDKSVISQCSTQIIMKVTNPNDLKAISSSVEGITNNTEKEIQDISIGTALVAGITDVPLFVRIRPRMSLHGGHAIDILGASNGTCSDEKQPDLIETLDEFNEKEIAPIIKPNTTSKDIMLMSEKKIDTIHTVLMPCFIVTCKNDEETFKLLVERETGKIIADKEAYCSGQGGAKRLPKLDTLSKKEVRILQAAFKLKSFDAVDLAHNIGSNLDIGPELDALVKKNYIIKDEKYHLNEEFIFNRLENYKFFEEPVFEQAKYSQKISAKLDSDAIITELQKFTSVSDHAECYLVTYHVVYGDEQ